MENPTVTVLVSKELLAQLGKWSAPVQVKVVETPGVGTGWEIIDRTVPTPAWAHRLLDAFLTGKPLNFGGEIPPPDIRERLDRAVADGAMGEVRQ